jgi:MarR family transcriptional regulator, organic hydroperoxide resistance regulator
VATKPVTPKTLPPEAGKAATRAEPKGERGGTQPPRAEVHERFGAALEEIFRAVLKASGRGVAGGDTELTLSQYFVMDALADEALTVSEVARAARVAVPTATRSLRALELRGFVDRDRDDGKDRRLVRVALTAEGRAVLDEKRTWVHRRQREIFESLTAEERATVTGALGAIAREIDEL